MTNPSIKKGFSFLKGTASLCIYIMYIISGIYQIGPSELVVKEVRVTTCPTKQKQCSFANERNNLDSVQGTHGGTHIIPTPFRG
jgi:hypothetical protein